MTKTYSSSTDFVNYELANIIVGGNEIPENFDMDELFDRCQAAGLIIWDDAYDEARDAYLLNYQGFRWAADENGELDEAAFWGIVEDVIADAEAL